jgi:hypothetical protein
MARKSASWSPFEKAESPLAHLAGAARRNHAHVGLLHAAQSGMKALQYGGRGKTTICGTDLHIMKAYSTFGNAAKVHAPKFIISNG